MRPLTFSITARDAASRARAGVLTTAHGVIQTPAFVPVGTKAGVKGVLPEHLRDAARRAHAERPVQVVAIDHVHVDEITVAETLDLLNLLPDPNVRATAVQRIAAAPAVGMFSEPYAYAGFEIYGLA